MSRRRRRRDDDRRAGLLAELRAEVADLDPAAWGLPRPPWPWAAEYDDGWTAAYTAWCVASVADVRRREYVALGLGGDHYTPDHYEAAVGVVAEVGSCAETVPPWWTPDREQHEPGEQRDTVAAEVERWLAEHANDTEE